MISLSTPALRHARTASVVGAVLLGGLVAPSSALAGTTGPTSAAPVATPGLVFSPPDRAIPVLFTLGENGSAQRPGVVSATGRNLFEISEEGGYGLPKAARAAYERAARRIERTRPGCGLPWGLLAGIGRVESDHGRFGGSKLGTDGVSRPKIIGIALDGVGPVAAIPDTDNGRLDRDKVWDRAVGPMQFIPSTWATSGVDGDNDGVADPHDLDDASLAAAGYLCPASGPIGGEAGMRAALFSYNRSDYYVDLVYAFAVGYQTGVFDIPSPPVEPDPVADEENAAEPDAPVEGPTTSEPTSPVEPEPEPSGPDPTPKPPKPTPSPTPQPTPAPSPAPTPTPVVLKTGSGVWSACAPGWCLSGLPLDLGGTVQSLAIAAEDFDGDGVVETNRAEFDGLVGTTVQVTLERGTAVVYLIRGLGFRNADGSFAS